MLRSFVAVGLTALACAPASAKEVSSPSSQFAAMVDQYYAELPSSHPTWATELGWHEHDGDLESLSPAAQQKELARLKAWDQKFSVFEKAALPDDAQADLKMLRLGIASQLLELEGVQSWRRRPDVYIETASRALYVLIKREFAPAAKRLDSAIAREEKIPALFLEARTNLRGVSKIALDIALDEMPDIESFFEHDVPLAFAGVKDAAQKARLERATAGVTRAIKDYDAFLRKEIAPHANAPFAIGEELFRKKLAADEMIDAPLDELLARGEAELKRLQNEFKKTAAQIDAKKTYAQVQEEMQRDHSTAASIIPDTQTRLAGLRRFLVEHRIVSLPSEIMPRVEETPPFMRATTMASMETPGAFETRATEAYYNVTLPERAWPAAQVEDFLRGAFNRPLIDVVSIHEAFPGHYVQFLWLPKLRSKVRKVESTNTNVEGWAHYCEQMMLDEGYGGGDPKLRLAQLQDALLRAARYVAGIRMHARGMTLEQAIDFFQHEGFQSRKVAEMEVKRGTEDPTYLYYTLGKLEILRLRDDYKKKLGAGYSLEKFHDAFLGEGALPISLVRKALVGG